MTCPICWCSLGHLPGCPDYDDRYQDELEEELSDCCGAEILAEDICSRCHEHCGVQEE